MNSDHLNLYDLSMKNIIRKEIEAGRYKSLDLPNNIEDIGIYRCICCETNLNGYSTAVAHATGKKHLKQASYSVISAEPVDCLNSQLSYLSTSECIQSSSSDSSSSSREESLERSDVSPVNSNMNISFEKALKMKYLKSDGNSFICAVCDNLPLSSQIVAEQHIVGSKHRKKLERRPSNFDNLEISFDARLTASLSRKITESPPDVSKKALEDQPFYCKCCDKHLNSLSQYENHNIGSNHLKKMKQKSSLLQVIELPKTEFPKTSFDLSTSTRTKFDDEIIIISAYEVLMNHSCFSD